MVVSHHFIISNLSNSLGCTSLMSKTSIFWSIYLNIRRKKYSHISQAYQIHITIQWIWKFLLSKDNSKIPPLLTPIQIHQLWSSSASSSSVGQLPTAPHSQSFQKPSPAVSPQHMPWRRDGDATGAQGGFRCLCLSLCHFVKINGLIVPSQRLTWFTWKWHHPGIRNEPNMETIHCWGTHSLNLRSVTRCFHQTWNKNTSRNII